MNSVQEIREAGVCCGCGICAAVCPKNAICHELSEDGQSGPRINEKCVNCGACKKVCPGEEIMQSSGAGEDQPSAVEEAAPVCVLAQSRDLDLLRGGTSGGFITTLVKALLDKGEYDNAFLVDSHAYGGIVQTVRIQRADALDQTQKSRYIQVAHTDEIAFLIHHPEERCILVGTACYFRGLLKVISKYGLKRDNYLLVGLFCDKTMTAHMWEYFNEIFAGKQLKALFFRDKEQNGWPGDVKLFLRDGTTKQLPRKERTGIKDYFVVQSCLYCVDKLNKAADISVGDNYISRRTDTREDGKCCLNVREGSNTVLLRSEKARELWLGLQELFWWEECAMEQVAHSQKMQQKADNGIYKELLRNGGTSEAYSQALEKMLLGQKRQYERIHAAVEEKRRRQANPVNRLLARGKGMCRKLLPWF